MEEIRSHPKVFRNHKLVLFSNTNVRELNPFILIRIQENNLRGDGGSGNTRVLEGY